ncbi:titin [Bicyclus anynana]|uniref:Titin n=1 Tax=Bicyclus anynana TaxID=110368 RepID=A0A6J1MH43_BICAN|nr:titin [Bicyclus anynana]
MAKKKNVKKSNAKKAPVAPPCLADTINTEVIAAALSSASVNGPVLLKVCRLCEAKDGPFLNIFEADKMTAKKIATVMPFGIAENDELPHKICFRCSAKLEELYEFIQKCIKTQENLHKALGNKGTGFKTKHRELWEEKLNKSNISNEDYCDALIKKAMEGIKDIPLNPLPIKEEKVPVKKITKKISSKIKEDNKIVSEEKVEDTSSKNLPTGVTDNRTEGSDDEPVISFKNMNKNDVDEDDLPVKRLTRLSNEKKADTTENKLIKKESLKSSKREQNETKVKEEPVFKENNLKIKQSLQINNFSLEETPKPELPKPETPKPEAPKSVPEPKSFDIMEHVSMIKVNGVGVLFQCKFCNRNFLKKEVVMSHACAKHGVAKIQNSKSFVPPDPPKIPSTVKYITTVPKKDESKHGILVDKTKAVENKAPVALSETINLDDDDDEDKPPPVTKPKKPKIGPASKIRRAETKTTPSTSEPLLQGNSNQNTVTATPNNTALVLPNITATITSGSQVPSVHFPTVPSLNSRYKLMPGPNNTFTLVEDTTVENVKTVEPPVTVPVTLTESKTTIPRHHNSTFKTVENAVLPNKDPSNLIASDSSPYPVGLIKSSSAYPPPLAFPTPAMKKLSYTVVQTGNPSKLLISTKPQPPPPEEDVPKKRPRKSRHTNNVNDKQQFSVTLEHTTPPATDPAFFTLINVDPLLQPSYVLPTDSIIQESQISTSTNVAKQAVDKDKTYLCNMCNEKFSREIKLMAHIHSHYNKMDEEDKKRGDKKPKKRARK